MFNRYWREYPWMFQLIQFVILILVTASFFVFGILPLVAKLIGVPQTETINLTEQSTGSIRHAALLYQFIGATAIFLLPALMFSYFTHPRPKQYLGLRKPGKPVQWVLVLMLMAGAIPVLVQIQAMVSLIPVSDSIRDMQEKMDAMMRGYLVMSNFGEFALCFLTLAILPAVSEELFFRGVMLRLAAKSTSKTVFSIILTGLVFALFHYNFFGFLSIFFAGVILGFIYYLTGSIWLSILAHLIHNGTQIILVYFFRDAAFAKNMVEEDSLPWFIPVAGLVLFIISFYLLWKNRTPLPKNWTDDFSEEEKMEIIKQNTAE